MHPLYDIVLADVKVDVGQMVEQGHDAEVLAAEVEAAAASGSLDELIRLQEDLWRRPSPTDFPYDEPDDWEAISATFPPPDAHAKLTGGQDDLADRLLGAWQGRCAGCQLGKPLEGTVWPDKIKTVLQTVGSWPLSDYMNPLGDDVDRSTLPDCDFFARPAKNAWTRGRFDCVAPDDDIHYSLVSLRTVEEHGAGFTSEQAARQIAMLLPFSTLWASGKSLFRTYVFGLRPPETARYGNPARQSLGAQIRCDPFGWCAPGNPALAARMACRDAVNSQVRNGIYSGVFFAAWLADTLATGDPVASLDVAAAYVPPRSRFAEMIAFARDLCARHDDWEQANAEMYRRYDDYTRRFNHAVPNAAVVIMAILMGGGDFTRTLGISVMAGLDTDCNGATTGSILGCALGARNIPAHWVEPFGDTIRSHVKDMPRVAVTDVARRTHVQALRYGRFARPRPR